MPQRPAIAAATAERFMASSLGGRQNQTRRQDAGVRGPSRHYCKAPHVLGAFGGLLAWQSPGLSLWSRMLVPPAAPVAMLTLWRTGALARLTSWPWASTSIDLAMESADLSLGALRRKGGTNGDASHLDFSRHAVWARRCWRIRSVGPTEPGGDDSRSSCQHTRRGGLRRRTDALRGAEYGLIAV